MSNKILVLTLISLQFILSANGQTKFTGYCEFDLVDKIPDILKSLPDECTAIYSNVADREAITKESIKFQEFMDVLAEKERWEEQVNEPGRTSLDLDYALRKAVYNSTLGNCTVTTETTQDYVLCKIEHREDLMDKINNPEESE